MKIPEDICQTIRDARKIVLATHVHPDGDALGSLFGIADVLEGLGKETFCYLEEPVPYLFSFLPGTQRGNMSLDDLSNFCEGEQVIALSLDCGDEDRLGKYKEELLKIQPFLVIDHHRSHKNFGNLRWVDPRCSSTGEMVYELALALGAELTYEAAYNLYVAISTDTGSFKYESTSARTMRIAAELIEKGVAPNEVSGHIHNNYTLERLTLLKMVLNTLKLYDSGRIALIDVSQQMFEESGAQAEDIDGFIDFPRSIASVKVAAFIKESGGEKISVSLRAKGECDVAEIAKSFGGGGHRNASGFRFMGEQPEKVKQLVIEALKDGLASLN